MKKVTFLIGRYGHKGGLEKYAHRLSQAFANKGCQVTLLTTAKQQPYYDAQVEVIPLAPPSKVALYQLIHFNSLCQKWLKRNPQDLVFGLERTCQQDLYRAGSGVHKVYLQRRLLQSSVLKRISLNINPLHKTILSYEKRAFEDPTLRTLFTNSKMVEEEIITHYAPKAAIKVVHNGVEWDGYSSCFAASKENRGPYHFLFVGNGYERKGLSFLLEALAKIKEKEWHLSIVGKEKNPALFSRKAMNAGIASKVTFYGPQNSLLPFYQNADSLVIPSLYDPFANVTLEALAMGLFIISSPFNGGKEILTPALGYVIEDLFNVECFTQALQNALDAPRDKKTKTTRRNSISHLDFSNQLELIVEHSLS